MFFAIINSFVLQFRSIRCRSSEIRKYFLNILDQLCSKTHFLYFRDLGYQRFHLNPSQINFYKHFSKYLHKTFIIHLSSQIVYNALLNIKFLKFCKMFAKLLLLFYIRKAIMLQGSFGIYLKKFYKKYMYTTIYKRSYSKHQFSFYGKFQRQTMFVWMVLQCIVNAIRS